MRAGSPFTQALQAVQMLSLSLRSHFQPSLWLRRSVRVMYRAQILVLLWLLKGRWRLATTLSIRIKAMRITLQGWEELVSTCSESWNWRPAERRAASFSVTCNVAVGQTLLTGCLQPTVALVQCVRWPTARRVSW